MKAASLHFCFESRIFVSKNTPVDFNQLLSIRKSGRASPFWCFIFLGRAEIFLTLDLTPHSECWKVSAHSSSVSQNVSLSSFLPSSHFPPSIGLLPGPHWHWYFSAQSFGSFRQISSHGNSRSQICSTRSGISRFFFQNGRIRTRDRHVS